MKVIWQSIHQWTNCLCECIVYIGDCISSTAARCGVIDNQSIISNNVFAKRCIINARFVPLANERNNRHYTYQWSGSRINIHVFLSKSDLWSESFICRPACSARVFNHIRGVCAYLGVCDMNARAVMYQFTRIYVYVSSSACTLMHANTYPGSTSKLVWEFVRELVRYAHETYVTEACTGCCITLTRYVPPFPHRPAAV